jgi:hypothetical protein
MRRSPMPGASRPTGGGKKSASSAQDSASPCREEGHHDYPDFTAWLVERGIDSIALNPDVAIKTALRVAEAERGAPAALACAAS